jgi:hypothetical protein
MKTFDLFRQFGPTSAQWIKDFAKLEDAENEMKIIAAKDPGAYFVYDEDAATAVSRLNSDRFTLYKR